MQYLWPKDSELCSCMWCKSGKWYMRLNETLVIPHLVFILNYLTFTLMPQSHYAESTPKWGRIDNSSLFGWSFVVIRGHSSNDNGNQFEQCSSRPCSFGRSVRKFWTCSKGLCTQQCPARIHFIRGYAHWKRVVIFFLAQLMCCINSSHSYCIRGCSNCILRHSYWQWDWGRPENSAN